MRSVSAGLRRLPDFLIIGAQKGGTTSLFRALGGHPDVRLPFAKEVHYFDLNHERGEHWYRRHFAVRTWGSATTRAGEASPYYLFHPHVPARAAQLVPHAKLLVLLRNPVERALSQFDHSRRIGAESLDFESALEREATMFPGALARMLEDPGYASIEHRERSYLNRGRYAEQLEGWFRHFAREQFLIEKSEDLFADPIAALDRIVRFLELPPRTFPAFPRLNVGADARMAQATRERLAAHFGPHNERLAALLGRDFGWS